MVVVGERDAATSKEGRDLLRRGGGGGQEGSNGKDVKKHAADNRDGKGGN